MAAHRRLNNKQSLLKLPSPEQLDMLLRLPTHETPAIRRFLKRIDGMEEIAQKTANVLERGDDSVLVAGVNAKVIRDDLADIEELRSIEEALFPFYRRAYENRLAADARVMSNLFRLWRVIQASRNRALKERFSFLGEWISRHRGRSSKVKPKPRPVRALLQTSFGGRSDE